MDPIEIACALEARKTKLFSENEESYRRNQPIASDIDPDSCLRRQVMEIVAPEGKAPFGPEARERMRAGREAERSAMRILDEMGIETTRHQVDFKLTHRTTGAKVLGGKIDCNLLHEYANAHGSRFVARVVCEVKLVSPWILDSIENADDMARHWWTKKYLSQMQSYLIGEGIEFGVFMLHDGKRWKWVGVSLDMEHAERVWRFAEQIVDAVLYYREHERVGQAALPAYTKDVAQCGRCAFFMRSCQPEIPTQAAGFTIDDDMEADLKRWWDLRASKREYDSIDKRLKPRLRQGPLLKIAGDFLIECKPRNGGASLEVSVTKIGVTRDEG
jgi:hypothetical protein